MRFWDVVKVKQVPRLVKGLPLQREVFRVFTSV